MAFLALILMCKEPRAPRFCCIGTTEKKIYYYYYCNQHGETGREEKIGAVGWGTGAATVREGRNSPHSYTHAHHVHRLKVRLLHASRVSLPPTQHSVVVVVYI